MLNKAIVSLLYGDKQMPTLRTLTLDSRLRLAHRAARMAGSVIMAHYGTLLNIRTKSSETDLVTQVDTECDELIRDVIREECPEDTLITEESFVAGNTIDLTRAWIVDPLDGTTNYTHAFPHFAVSIAYVEDGEVQAGVIYDPFKNEMFTATHKGDVMRNGTPIQVSACESLSKSLLATGFPYDVKEQDASKSNIELHSQFLRKTHGIRRPGAAALDLAYVACGRLDGFWELRLAPWDIAAGILLIEQAGGQVSDLYGRKVDLSQRCIDVVGSNGKIQQEILSVTTAAAL